MCFGIAAGCANLWHTLFGSSRPRPHAGPLPVNLTWRQATAIYLQLLDAVDWMQNRLSDPEGRFCVHRDISPGNIVISWPQGRSGLPQIKLVDFGLSEVRAQHRHDSGQVAAQCQPPPPSTDATARQRAVSAQCLRYRAP